MGQLKYNKHGEERLEILGRKRTRQEELYVNHASVWVDVKALESCFSQIPILRHVFLAGDRNRGSLVAVVVLANEHVDTEEDEIIRQFERFAPKDVKSYVGVTTLERALTHKYTKFRYEIPHAAALVPFESWRRAVESGHSSKIQRFFLAEDS